MSKSWGTPTWIFFHTLAEHINPEFYIHNRDIIKSFINSICNNLPCPECTKHAIQYNKFNLTNTNIENKEKLKMFFFNFHNTVNVRKNKPLFKDLHYYRNNKLSIAYLNFKRAYLRNNVLSRAFCDSLQRRSIIKNLDSFFLSNKSNFTWL
jgi:hypothetical protein